MQPREKLLIESITEARQTIFLHLRKSVHHFSEEERYVYPKDESGRLTDLQWLIGECEDLKK